MAKPKQRKSDAARRANQVIRSRTVLVMAILGVITFVVLFWKLYDLQINQHEAMQTRAVNQQTRSAVVTASRGTIYDRNGNTLAVSATAETINISPKEIAEFVESQEKAIEEAAAKAAEKGESYTAPEIRDQAYIARGLSRILEKDQADIEKAMEDLGSMYYNVRKKVEQEVADEVRRFINGEQRGSGGPAKKAAGRLDSAGYQAVLYLQHPGGQCAGLCQRRQCGRGGPGGEIQRRAGGDGRYDRDRQKRRGNRPAVPV